MRSTRPQETHSTHTQHKAQRRTTARTNTPRHDRHSTGHTAQGKTTKDSAGKHRTTGQWTALEGTTQQATAPNERNNTRRQGKAQRRVGQRAATRRSTKRGNTAQHSTRNRRPKQESTPHREKRSTTTQPETRHTTQQPNSTAQHKKKSTRRVEVREANKTNNGGGGAEKAVKKRGGGQRGKAGWKETSTKQAGRKEKHGKKSGGQGWGGHGAQRSRTPRAGNQRKTETPGVRGEEKKKEGKQKDKKGETPARRWPSKAEGKATTGKVRRTRTRPGGPPALPGQGKRAHTHTHTGPGRDVLLPGRSRRPNKTAPVHRPSPPSKDGRYGKPDASVTGSAHPNPPQRKHPRTDTGGTRQRQPHCRVPNGYDAQRAHCPCLGRGQWQAE